MAGEGLKKGEVGIWTSVGTGKSLCCSLLFWFQGFWANRVTHYKYGTKHKVKEETEQQAVILTLDSVGWDLIFWKC